MSRLLPVFGLLHLNRETFNMQILLSVFLIQFSVSKDTEVFFYVERYHVFLLGLALYEVIVYMHLLHMFGFIHHET